jgi:hypothetical protein
MIKISGINDYDLKEEKRIQRPIGKQTDMSSLKDLITYRQRVRIAVGW